MRENNCFLLLGSPRFQNLVPTYPQVKWGIIDVVVQTRTSNDWLVKWMSFNHSWAHTKRLQRLFGLFNDGEKSLDARERRHTLTWFKIERDQSKSNWNMKKGARGLGRGGFEPQAFHTQTLKTSAWPLGPNANSFKSCFQQNIY